MNRDTTSVLGSCHVLAQFRSLSPGARRMSHGRGSLVVVAEKLHPDILEVLDGELYAVAEAARLLRMSAQTLRNWIHGHKRSGRLYLPVLRAERSESGVTWGEFIESAYLSFYRQERKISMQQVRRAIEGLRVRYPDIRYPLAHFEPLTSQGELLTEKSEGDVELAASGQLLLVDAVIRRFTKAVDWDRDIAIRLRPDPENERVLIDPRQSFGVPTVGGIRTEILWELFQTGESVQDITAMYGVEHADVEAAIRFESARNELALSK